MRIGGNRLNRLKQRAREFLLFASWFIAQSSERERTAHQRRVNSVTGDPSTRDSTILNPLASAGT